MYPSLITARRCCVFPFPFAQLDPRTSFVSFRILSPKRAFILSPWGGQRREEISTDGSFRTSAPTTSEPVKGRQEDRLLFGHLHSEPLRIAPGEVHVWWLRTDGVLTLPGLLESCGNLLERSEMEECLEAKESNGRKVRMVARAFARSILARYLAAEASPEPAPHPSSLRFVRNAHGKPELLHPSVARDQTCCGVATSADYVEEAREYERGVASLKDPTGSRLRFNVTHTAGLIGVAIARGVSVGIDAEKMSRRTRNDPLRLARRRFSESEIRQLEALVDEDSRNEHFLRIWTLKEAYVKALGRGINAPPGLSGFSFLLDREEQVQHDAGISRGSSYGSRLCKHRSSGCGGSEGSAASNERMSSDHGASFEPSNGGFGTSKVLSCSNSRVLMEEERQKTLRIRFETVAASATTRATDDAKKDCCDGKEPSWCFALFHPTDEHVSALCLEMNDGSRQDGASTSSGSERWMSRRIGGDAIVRDRDQGTVDDEKTRNGESVPMKDVPNVHVFLCDHASCTKAVVRCSPPFREEKREHDEGSREMLSRILVGGGLSR